SPRGASCRGHEARKGAYIAHLVTETRKPSRRGASGALVEGVHRRPGAVSHDPFDPLDGSVEQVGELCAVAGGEIAEDVADGATRLRAADTEAQPRKTRIAKLGDGGLEAIVPRRPTTDLEAQRPKSQVELVVDDEDM